MFSPDPVIPEEESISAPLPPIGELGGGEDGKDSMAGFHHRSASSDEERDVVIGALHEVPSLEALPAAEEEAEPTVAVYLAERSFEFGASSPDDSEEEEEIGALHEDHA